MSKRNWSSQTVQRRDNSFPRSQDCPGPSSQRNELSQRNARSVRSAGSNLSSSQSTVLQNMDNQEMTQLVGCMIRYLLVADRSRLPIHRTHIIKNALNGNNRQFQLLIDTVKENLLKVFGYKLIEIEPNRYILVNNMTNNLPHLTFEKVASAQVLLFLVLVHIFMVGESCKEESVWAFLQKLGIIINDSFQHEYFGDIKQLVTIDFVNQRYLTKIINKDDASQVKYEWGKRAKYEITYRSALEFVAEIYGQSSLDSSLEKHWKLQYDNMIKQEKEQKDK